MRRSQKALGSVDRRFIEPSAALWKAIWKPRSTRSRARAANASSPESKRRFWSRPPAPPRPRGASAGRWNCWRARWSSSPSMTACRARPSAGAWPRMISSPGAGTCGASLRSMESMSPGWKTCSTSTPKGMIQSDPSYALMKARISSSARFASQFRPSWASRNAMIANTGAMGRLISLSSSTRIDLGAGSRSLNSVPLRILPHACAISSISITLTPMSSGSFSTISRPIPPAHFTKPFRRQKPTASCAAWNSTSRPSTPVG